MNSQAMIVALNSRNDIKDLSQKLSSWRKESEESQRRLDEILNSCNWRIDKSIHNLIEEVGNLQTKLSIMTKERNDLLTAVNKLSEIGLLRAKMPEPKEDQNKDLPEVSSLESGISEVDDNGGENFFHNLSGYQKSQTSYAISELEENHSQDTEVVDCQESADFEKELPDNEFGVERGVHERMPKRNEYFEEEWPENDIDPDQALRQQNKVVEKRDKIVSNAYTDTDVNNLGFVIEGKPEIQNKEHKEETVTKPEETLVQNSDVVDCREDCGRERKFNCNLCSYRSNTNYNMKRHIQEVHEKRKNHVCEECGYSAFEKERVEQHKAAVHKMGEELMCELCPYKTYHKKLLKKHVKEKCGRERKFLCELCPYKSNRSDNLRTHI